MTDPAVLLHLLRQTRNLLAAHAVLGLSSYPAALELRHFAAGRCSTPASPPLRAERRPAPVEKKTEPAAQQQAVLTLSEIARQLSGCRRCTAAADPAPGLGAERPKLVVVGDCRLASLAAADVLWSREEDELFWRMMAKIQLDRNAVYVTNTVKCVQQALPPSDKTAQGCLFWLEQELRSLRPALLCAVGETAAWLLTGKKIPLLRLRGKLHPCRLTAASQAQVLVTYHPRLLLQQLDLRWAAWEDLQLLQRRLAAKPG
ncbi:uracil-DNA glycosylase family protein [Candidatus Electronema sp. TJ]|uniref:uracil-DNA glycosylase family protein n=1 Tax=Candidatus Electronema sp. TJ TaxID=3401573 RepID=UPI003AA9D476